MEAGSSVPPETRIQRKHREKRDGILEKALIILNDKGLHGMSLNQLAKSLDYVPAALYRYFSSWEELLFNLQIVVLKKARLDLTDVIGATVDGGQERVSQESVLCHVFELSRWCCQFSKNAPNEFGLLSQMIADPKHLLSEQYFAASSYEVLLFVEHFADAFQKGVEIDTFVMEDSKLSAFIFIVSTFGVLQSRKLTRYLVNVPSGDAMVKNHTAALLKGWGANAQLVDRIAKQFVEPTT